MKELVVTLPAYNEEKELNSLVSAWQELTEKIKIEFNLNLFLLIINDGSSDKTEQIGLELQRKYDNVFLINHAVNMGLGMALKTACFNTVETHPNAEYMLLMDCDNTHRPEYVIDMITEQRKSKADIVIASRYCSNSSIKGLSKIREFISEGAKIIFSGTLRIPNVKDYTCGYRLYKIEILKKAIERFGENLVTQSGFTCMVELLYKLYTVNASFKEVPFELRYDLKQGESKMKVIKTAVNSFKLAINLRKIKKITNY